MKISILKRGVILLIAVIMCLSTFVSVGALNAFADEVPEQDKTVVFSFPRDGDENYTAEWGHEELHYMNGWSQKESKRTHIYAIGSWEGNICYCIEPGTPIDNDQTVNSNEEAYWDNYPSEYNKTLIPDDIKKFIGRIMQYGYCGTVTTAWRSQNEADADKMSHAIATQLLIWETIVGERDENFNHVDAGECNAILDTISVNHPLYNRVMTYYNSMVKSVQNHSKIPSFFKKSSSSTQYVTLSWNGSKYTATLTDTNNVLGNYTFTTNNSKVTCSVSGNKLTVSSSTAINSEVTITANKVNGKRKGMVVWGDGIYDTGTGDIQDLVTFSAEVDDPVVGYMKVKASSGSAKIVKTSEDGKVGGVKFTVVGNGINATVTTNANGEITVPNLTVGTYTVTEVVDNIYEPQESRIVTVVAGQTATVTFNNTLKRGNLVVTKTSEDGLVSGVKFRLYGKADNGLSVDEYAVTDSSGKAYFNDVLIGSNYTLVEVDTKAYYITPVAQTVKIEWNKATNKTVNNVLKLGELKVTKTAEDGMVSGVKFRLYGTSDSGIAVNLYATTNANGVAEFKNVLMGSNYKLEEVDTKAYYITPSVQNAKIEWNKVTNKSFNNVLKRGNLVVTKTSDDGFVKDITFRLYGTAANGTTVDVTAKTNASGKAYFNDILIGSNYKLEEVNTKAYYITPITQTGVTIKWDDVTNSSVHNELKVGDLTVTKTAEDGLVSGVKFHLYGTSDSGIKVDEYATTNSKGIAEFKNILIGSNYTLEEVDAEAYYVTPVKQTGVKIGWNKVTNKSFNNVLKRGGLKVVKTSEDDMVEGVKFHLVGTSDSGIKVDMYAITNKNGVAVFEDVLIGKNYMLSEVNTEFKYITPVSQNTTIKWDKVTEKDFYNELKRGDLTITKNSEDGLVEGITFRLYGKAECGQYVDVYATTDKSGKAYFKDILIGYGYTIEECNVSEKYITPAAQTNVVIEWEKVTHITFENVLKCGDLKVTKTAEDGLVEGLTFHLYGYSLSGIYVDEYAVTNGNGIAEFKDILIGSNYTLEESNCPDRYVVPKLQDAAIEWDKVCEIYAYNELKKSTVIGKKVDEDGFSIAGALFGLFKHDETVFTEETALMVSESNEIGVFGFKNVPYGNWIIRELKPAPAFVLNEEIYDVNITEDEQIIEITAVNRFICGCVRVWKLDEEVPDSKLLNAVFAVYCDVDGNGEFNAEIDMLVGELAELEAGFYGMDNLRYNGYFLHEEKAPDGFIKDDNYYYFEIRNDGEVIYIENKVGVGFVNKPILSNVQTTKVDEEYPDNKLSGAVFGIYLDTDGDGVFNAETDTLIGEMTETEIGVYTYEALRMGGYFLYEKTAPIGFVKDNDYYYFEITEDGKTVTVENESGVGFANKPITGELKILKIVSETKQPLANVGFRVMDADGNIIEEAYTDENGIVTFNLRYGEYTYCEFSPLEGYYANNEVYPFAIIEDGEVIEIEFENEPIPEPDPPQTGDNNLIGFWIGLAAIAFGGIIAAVIVIIKQKKEDDN